MGGLCYQPNYKNWAPNDVYSASVSPTLSLKQEVIAECNGLTEFRVWLDASEADPQGATEFSLPDPNSAGKHYLFDIRAAQGQGPQIAYSLQQEYPEGTLYENDDDVNRDMIFKMGCVAGWTQ
jgi:hypothetical protein